jgi:hypothetical protein
MSKFISGYVLGAILTSILVLVSIALFGVADCEGAELRRVTFETSKVYNYRHSYFPEYTLLNEAPVDGEEQGEVWDYHIALGLNLNLLTTEEGTLYWDQLVEGDSTTKQFRRTSWLFEFGINFGEFEIYRSHMSEHILDERINEEYPLRDLYGIRLCFAGSDCGRN